MPELTTEQRLAVETLDRPVTLVAAAGSGKTTVLVRRYLELLKRGATPSQILTVTFTKDAADQLRERIRAALLAEWELRPDSDTVRAVETTSTIGTLHSFCYGVLNQFGSVLGLPPIATILDPFARAESFDSSYRRWQESLSPEELREWLAHFQPHDLRALVEEAHAQRHALRRALRQPLGAFASASEPLLLELLEKLDRQLLQPADEEQHRRGVYSFDDLEHLALRILRESAEARKRLRESLQYFLVDEFQDTSRLQWEILDTILDGDYRNLFVVGDPKQSIYSFRHADVRLFYETSERMAKDGGEILELTVNFRSRPELISHVNELSEILFRGSTLEGGGFTPMRARESHDEPPGELRVRSYVAEEGKAAELTQSEIKQVVANAKEILKRASPGELAILFRVSDRIGEYARALEAAGIPVSCRRTGRLFSTYEAADLLQYLRALANPLDDHALGAFLRSPYVGFSLPELWQVTQLPGDSLLEKLMHAPRNLRERAAWLGGVIESGVHEVAPALQALFSNSGYWPRESGVLLELLGPLTAAPLSIAEALERIRTWERSDILFQSETGDGREAVELMTVHGAKGLEFPHVFLVDNLRRSPKSFPILRVRPDSAPGLRYRVEDELTATPTYQELQEAAERATLEESQRILYVALTRAKQTLSVFLPRNPAFVPKNTWGETLYGQFVKQAPQTVTD